MWEVRGGGRGGQELCVTKSEVQARGAGPLCFPNLAPALVRCLLLIDTQVGYVNT